MDHVGGYINPLTLIRRIPKGLAIPRLRDRLRTIIGDFRTQTSLHEGCNGILRSDCMHLMHRWGGPVSVWEVWDIWEVGKVWEVWEYRCLYAVAR